MSSSTLNLGAIIKSDTAENYRLTDNNELIIKSDSFKALSDKNYKEIKDIFKTEAVSAIDSLFSLLSKAPEGSIDWVKIKELLSANYKSENQYERLEKAIQANILKQLSHEEREAIINKIENNNDSVASNSNATSLASTNSAQSPVETASSLKSSNKKCIFVNFNSALFAPQWGHIKEQYEIFHALKDQNAPEIYLEINSYLNTMLPMLIKAEEGLIKMHSSTDVSDEKSLMVNNLNLVAKKIENLNLQAKSAINRDLSVAQSYHNKTMTMGKN